MCELSQYMEHTLHQINSSTLKRDTNFSGKQSSNPWLIAGFIVNLGVYMGLSENSVPLNPMVNDHYPY